MPTFQQIYSNFNKAKEKQLIGPDESLSDYAKKVMAITGDPSYQSVAEGGTVGNWVRSRSADLTGLVNSGPVDEWLGEGTKFVGDFFGVDPKTSRAVGESLPRMAVDYLPLAVGGALAPFTGGASLAPGLAMTSGLSAASGYEQSGEISDAIIGGAAPYVGGKLSEIGGKAALNLVPKSQILQRLGFTGGTQVTGRALSAAEQAGMVANRGVTDAVAKATTKSFTELDKPLDKLLHYVGGEALANVGFTGLDIAQQGTDAVFNRDYLFANLVSNIPFAAADLAGSFANRPVGEVKYNLPEAKPQYLSPGEERAVYAAAMFKDLESPEAIAQWRKKYGLDVADIAIKTEEVKMALDAKESGLRTAETNFVSKWNELSKQNPELNINLIQPEEISNVIGQAELPIAFKEAVDEFKSQTSSLKGKFNAVIDKVGTPVNTVESLQKGVQELGLDEFLNTPIEQRDYAKALEGTFVSLDGADLIRDIHRSEAGLQPLRADLFEQYSKLIKGEDVNLTPDKHMEVIVAASLASGKKPVFEVAKKKAQEAVKEGQPDEVIVKEALKGMKEGNKDVVEGFKKPEQKSHQPVVLGDTLSELIALNARSKVDLTEEMVNRPGVKQQFIPDQVESGLTEKPPVSPADLVSGLSKREVKPQVEQTVVEKLIASIPAKWPDEVKNIVAEFYRTGDDTQLKEIGIDKDSETRKKVAYRALKEADPTYEARLKAWEQNNAKADRERKKVLNKLPVHTERLEPDLVSAVDQYKINQEKLPMDFFRAEDWSRLKDQDGNEYLIPLPEGEFQQVEQFARGLMSKLVSPEMLPESSKELINLAKLFNNPEVAYAELGKMVKGKSDVQFARASAGAFDFGMREVQNGKLIRPGKPPLGTKDGWMTELEFRVNGGDLGPLQKDEVAFYKQLVPEAFANDKVHLQKLWDGLGKVGEQVKVVTYGQEGKVSAAKQEFDKLRHDWYDATSGSDKLISRVRGGADDAILAQLGYSSFDIQNAKRYLDLEYKIDNEPIIEGPRATSYYNQISPFDTKKFPVLRVDVVLPLSKKTQDAIDRGVDSLGREREIKWQPDNLHENLPNTLGWAMVQIVPDPKTGEKVMFVGEAQSRWAQKRREDEKAYGKYMDREDASGAGIVAPSHPLLPIHQNLILKSVIKEAQKQGITKVAISDGETAMMTEGHDKSAKAVIDKVVKEHPQISDYDVQAQEDFRQSLGAKPAGYNVEQPIGKQIAYRNAWKLNNGNHLYFKQVTSEDGKVPGGFATKVIPVEYTPKLDVSQEGGMRLAYDTTMPSIMSKLVGEGEMRDFGVHKNATSISAEAGLTQLGFAQDSEAMQAMRNMPRGSPVFRNPDGTPKTNVTARVYDISNPSPRADTLFAQNQGRVYGAASYKAKQIFINSKAFQGFRSSDRAAFVFAHEQSHISFAKAIEGKYGPQAKIQAEKALAWVNAANQQAKKNVEDVLKELHLDKEIAQMDGIRDVLNNPDPQEWLANVMGMYGFGAVKAKAPKQAFAMLPKPVRDFAEWLVSHLQNLTKGAVTWLRLSGKDYQGAKHTKELFDSIRRSYRQVEWDAAQAERLLDIEPSSMLERGNEFAFARSQVKELKFDEAPKAVIGTWWNKIIQPIHTLANAHKEFVEPVMAVMNAHSDTSNAIGDVFKVVTGELDGNDKLRMTNKAFKRVFGSEPLAKLFNAIQTRSRVMNRRMLTVDDVKNVEVLDMTALSPELRGRVAQFNPEAQQALVTMIAQAERANKLTQLKNLEADWQGSVHNLATLLAAKPSFAGQNYKKAVEISKGMMEDLKVGDVENALSKVAMLDETDQARAMEQAQDIFKQYANLEKFYQDHPTFMSFRRFGKIKQRIQKAGEQDDVIDADSEGELQEVLKIYKAKGWTEKGSRIEESKNFQRQYEINSGLLKVMNEKEQAFREMIQNEVNLSDDLKKKILSAPTASEAMMKEINSRELYRPKVGTKFAGDLERFDWWEQFQRYTPAAIAAAQRRALGAKVNFWMQNPALNDMQLQKDQFMNLYEQSKQPDPEWARKLNKLNAVWHIGWNLPGHIAEVFQPMLSGVHEFVAKGESLPGALKLFWRAEKETARMHGYKLKDKFFNPERAKITVGSEEFEGLPAVWLRANGTSKDNLDVARMLHAKRDRIQKAPLSELRDFTGENHARLQDSIDGKKQRTLGEIIASPFTMYANAAMNFYSNFTRHNGVVTMVAAYRKFRKDGLNHEEAMQKAELFDLTVNNSGGRLERPEMFGKLGGAGHLPYGLTSYTRGRFSQLATYYRHGFDAKQFEGKLSPSEIKNAKKAFQTMILAQLGAAGILGMPFVGAGIALMEDLLDEDIKGKMINALDEVTNDPLLTRMFTHGMMSTIAESVGVPADLHSRFALSSFLGTNSYDGMSAKSFMGPSVAMLDSMFNLGGQIAQGEKLEKALTVAGPGGVKRLSEALSEDFRRNNPEANLTMSMLGFRSSQQVKRKEWEQITRNQELETRKKLTESATLISKAMTVSPQEGRKQLLIEADRLLPKGLDYQATLKQRQQNVKDLVQKVALIEADKVGPQDVRREISGRLAPVASQTARSMGVQMPDPIEMARSMAQQKTRSQLGATSSQRPVRNAMLRDMQWERNPWEF